MITKDALKKEVSATLQFEEMKDKRTSKSKIDFLMRGQTNTCPETRRKPYMNKLNRKQVSTIFKARTRMLDIKNNFRGKYDNMLCRGCGQASETQEHVFEECPTIHPNEISKVLNEHIFNEDPEHLKAVIVKIDRIITTPSQSVVYNNNDIQPCQLGSHST